MAFSQQTNSSAWGTAAPIVNGWGTAALPEGWGDPPRREANEPAGSLPWAGLSNPNESVTLVNSAWSSPLRRDDGRTPTVTSGWGGSCPPLSLVRPLPSPAAVHPPQAGRPVSNWDQGPVPPLTPTIATTNTAWGTPAIMTEPISAPDPSLRPVSPNPASTNLINTSNSTRDGPPGSALRVQEHSLGPNSNPYSSSVNPLAAITSTALVSQPTYRPRPPRHNTVPAILLAPGETDPVPAGLTPSENGPAPAAEEARRAGDGLQTPQERVAWLLRVQTKMASHLGVFVKDRALLAAMLSDAAMLRWEVAFTHNSYNSDPRANYEDMEWKGDALLKALFADYLFQRYPYFNNAQYSNLNHGYMSSQRQSKLAESLGFRDLVRTRSIGQVSDKILTDVFESVVGAMQEIILMVAGQFIPPALNTILTPYGMSMTVAWDYIHYIFDGLEIDLSFAEGPPRTLFQQMFPKPQMGYPSPENRTSGDVSVTTVFLNGHQLNYIRQFGINNVPVVTGEQLYPVATGTGYSREEADEEAFRNALVVAKERWGISPAWAADARAEMEISNHSELSSKVPGVVARLKQEGYLPRFRFVTPAKTKARDRAGQGASSDVVVQLTGYYEAPPVNPGDPPMLVPAILGSQSGGLSGDRFNLVMKASLMDHYARNGSVGGGRTGQAAVQAGIQPKIAGASIRPL